MTVKNVIWNFLVITLAAIGLISCPVFSATDLSSTIYTDIEYSVTDGKPVHVDACVPTDSDNNPIVILVHGGGWVGGQKEDMHFLFEPLVKAGFTCFSVQYRLAPDSRWPACIDDVRTAVKWVKSNASSYKGDANRIALVGYSAGGHLACLAAIHEKVQAVVGISPPTDHLSDADRRGGVSGCLQQLFNKPKELDEESTQLLKDISPINFVHSKLPPHLLIHGTADQSVLYSQSLEYQKALQAKGVSCDIYTIQDAPHRISTWPKYAGGVFAPAMIDWLNIKIGGKGDIAKLQDVLIVNADGSGDFLTVQGAVNAVPDGNTKPITIKIAPGTYQEIIVVPATKPFISFIGEDAEKTILTFNLYARMKDYLGNEIGTFRTKSVSLEANDFTAENITFENSAGPVGQALAIAVLGDRTVFKNCRFLGWQDTILDQTGRHYYENCYIVGNCDFIFGGGTAFFENCHIHFVKSGYITAASTPEDQEYGYVFSNCKVTGENDDIKVYLGRPWRDFASVIFMNTEMSSIVRPEGWHNWGKPNREQTSRYYEYNSTGPGAKPDQRVKWVHTLTKEEADSITVEKVLSGIDGWDPIKGTVKSSLQINEISEEQADALKKKLNTKADNKVLIAACSSRKDNKGLYLACSDNGLNWRSLGGPFLIHTAEPTAFDGSFLAHDDSGVFNYIWPFGGRGVLAVGYTNSNNLTACSDSKLIELKSHLDALDIVKPKLFYDSDNSQYILSWASTINKNYFQCYQEPDGDNPRIWYVTTKDFNTFSQPKILFEPGYSVEDAVLVKYKSGYALIHEDSRKCFQTLCTAFGSSATGPWTTVTNGLPLEYCQNPAAINVNGQYLVYCQKGPNQSASLLITNDFDTWTDASKYLSFPDDYKVCSIIEVNRSVIDDVEKKIYSAEEIKKSYSEIIKPLCTPFKMDNLIRPSFPDKVFDVRQYGAIADGVAVNTKPFADAIEACSKAGGGHVLVPYGKWYTGPIHFKSNVNLHIADGAEIIFSDKFSDYLPPVLVRVGGIELYNYSPLIYANNCKNIAITGSGTLNGNADKWWQWKGYETGDFFKMAASGVPVKERVFASENAKIRPSFLCLMNCQDVLMEGFTITGGPNWTLHPIYCENVIVRRISVSTKGPNNDGIDPDSCKNVLIENCVFDTGDDCLVLKSGYNEDGWRVGIPSENVVIRNCVGGGGHGGIVIGSEMSGNVRNVFAHDCDFGNVDRGIRIKSKIGRGGVVENVWIKDVRFGRIKYEAIVFDMDYESDRNKVYSDRSPKFRNFNIQNVSCKRSARPIVIRGLQAGAIENVYFENISLYAKKGNIIQNVNNAAFNKVSVISDSKPVYQIFDSKNIRISENEVKENSSVFMEVRGQTSSDIVVSKTDLSNVGKNLVLKDGASDKAVSFE